MIEDTSFIIDILRGDETALAHLDLIEADNRPEKVASITLLELYEGLIRADAPASQRDAITEVLESKHVVASDADVMREAGTMSGTLRSRGEQIDREDCIVGATARLEDEPVMTRHVDHFERIDGLVVESY